jgi:hypothetical protein
MVFFLMQQRLVLYKLKHKEITRGLPINLIASQLIKQPTYGSRTGFVCLNTVVTVRLRVNSVRLQEGNFMSFSFPEIKVFFIANYF